MEENNLKITRFCLVITLALGLLLQWDNYSIFTTISSIIYGYFLCAIINYIKFQRKGLWVLFLKTLQKYKRSKK